MYYEFYCPVKILSGDNAIFNLPNELERLNANNPLIVTDKGIIDSGIIDKFIKKVFKEINKPMPFIFSDIPVESSVKAVEKALVFFKEKKCDSIIAIGGGSVIDSSKALNMLIGENKTNLLNLEGVDIINKKGVPFIAVPTTAGTGSEVTSVAVIFDEESNSKLAFSSALLMPDVALIDTDMTTTMPKKLTASSGIDALSHAIEAFISIQSNPISKALAFESVKIIWENLPVAIKDGKNKQARLNMSDASVMAGMAFSNSMVGIIHSLAHATGSILHIPHGLAVSLFLVPGIKENAESSKEELAYLLNAVSYMNEYRGTTKQKASRFVYFLEKFIKDIRELSDLPTTLNEVGFKKEYEKQIIDLALKDGSSIFNKIELDENRAKNMIKLANI